MNPKRCWLRKKNNSIFNQNFHLLFQRGNSWYIFAEAYWGHSLKKIYNQNFNSELSKFLDFYKVEISSFRMSKFRD